ncbi:hypothetical protein PRZ48_002562 [Zasmidium cellare]|uniref:Uncharacterized protein n=1 Tax=Zasmidium cellare TaxID=395010 RepID=A0ABR0F7P8_ZASCE|nr:hypothetical protein PRZ48_002562 [Zasmidium cellare]
MSSLGAPPPPHRTPRLAQPLPSAASSTASQEGDDDEDEDDDEVEEEVDPETYVNVPALLTSGPNLATFISNLYLF